MTIYRNGQPIELTNEEMQAAYAEVNHQYELEFVRDMFLERFGEKDGEVSIPCFSDAYGFSPEDAVDPNSEHYLLERLLKCYKERESSHVADYVVWECVFHETMAEIQDAYEWISKAKANASVEDGVTTYYYKLWVEPRHSESYPVYVKSDKLLTWDETVKKAQEECYMFTIEDGECLSWGEAVTKQQYDNRLDPDEYCRINYGEDEDEDDDLDCDGECVGCDRACADRIPDPADTAEK